MRLSSYILVVLTIGLCFALVGYVVNDFEVYYPDINVDTAWEDDYDYVNEINSSMGGVQEKFDKIADEDIGWFSQITTGIVAIPIVIIAMPVVIFKTIKYAILIFSSVATNIGIPPFVQLFGTLAIIIVITFALISFWHRWRA